MKVSEVLEDWPPRKWASDDTGSRALASDPGKLRLLWFSVPDADGWFRLTATDSQGASWSTYCRARTQVVWQPLENALAESLQEPLDLAGHVELESGPRPRVRWAGAWLVCNAARCHIARQESGLRAKSTWGCDGSQAARSAMVGRWRPPRSAAPIARPRQSRLR